MCRIGKFSLTLAGNSSGSVYSGLPAVVFAVATGVATTKTAAIRRLRLRLVVTSGRDDDLHSVFVTSASCAMHCSSAQGHSPISHASAIFRSRVKGNFTNAVTALTSRPARIPFKLGVVGTVLLPAAEQPRLDYNEGF